jgi:hypothetical protein
MSKNVDILTEEMVWMHEKCDEQCPPACEGVRKGQWLSIGVDLPFEPEADELEEIMVLLRGEIQKQVDHISDPEFRTFMKEARADRAYAATFAHRMVS